MYKLAMDKMIEPYDGSGDIQQWIKRVELISKVQKWEDLSAVLPLFLTGAAFAVYEHLEPEEQNDINAIKLALRNAFAMDRYQAYQALIERKWNNEAVDSYLSDLRNLTALAGFKEEAVLKSAFIVGLPHDVSRQLRANTKIELMTLGEIVRQARIFLSDVHRDIGLAAAKGHEKTINKDIENRSDDLVRKCFKCRSEEHLANSCPKRSPRKCYKCGLTGHSFNSCNSGNGQEESQAPVVPRQ